MIQLNTFSYLTGSDFDNDVFLDAVNEINGIIKENAGVFRLQIELGSNTVESLLYKNALTNYYIKKGYKIITYENFIYIEWARINVNERINEENLVDIDKLGNNFSSEELYFSLTRGKDLRKISYRVLDYLVKREISKMKNLSINKSKIAFDVNTLMSPDYLNNMFAPELKMLNDVYDNIMFTFKEGCFLEINIDSEPVLYTDIPLDIIYGSRPYK